MLSVSYWRIYETNEKTDKEWVLIIYDILSKSLRWDASLF